MGYSYDRSGRLSCDNCGAADGKTRRRKCPHTVAAVAPLARSSARPALLPGPGTLPGMLDAARQGQKIHDQCKAPAVASQAEYDAEQAELEAGGAHVVCAEGLGDGTVKVTFRYLDGGEVTAIVPKAEYQPSSKPWLTDYVHTDTLDAIAAELAV